MASSAIEVRNVRRDFGEIRAVDDVSLSVARGEILGLVGHNGAGKSTLFRLMLGLIPVTAGDIMIDGQSVRGAAFREVRRNVGYLPESVVLYDNLTGLETLRFFADLKGIPRAACPPLMEKVGLAAALNRRVSGYSKGMRQRLGFAQALLGEPALLFLDEPTAGLDPESRREFYSMLRDMRTRGVTAILTSHVLAEMQERVDRIVIMSEGKVGTVGSVQELREEAHLRLRIALVARAGTPQALQATLTTAGIEDVTVSDGRVLVGCAMGDKMTVLGKLSPFLAEIADLQIKEPTLEDIFLGYTAHHRGHAA